MITYTGLKCKHIFRKFVRIFPKTILTNGCSRIIIISQLKNKRSQTYVLEVWEEFTMMKEYKGQTTVTGNTRRNVPSTEKHARKAQRRHFPFASLLLLCLAVIAVLRFTSVDASADVPERYKYYTNVYVDRDTTLWGVAQEYISDEYANARAYMEEVKSINHLPDDQLIYGTTICVPYYSDEYRK